MSYPDDLYKLKEKSNIELHEWVAEYKPGTAEYVAGIQESMRRVASIEELMEKNDAPVIKRELIAMGIAILALAVAVIAIVLSYQ
jgi:hypothetical protein